MNRPDFSKILFYYVSIMGVILFTFGFGLHAGIERNVFYRFTTAVGQYIEYATTTTLGEFTTLTGLHPKHFLQPARYAGHGVTVNDLANDQRDLLFMTGFFEGNNELRLIRRDGSVVKRWTVVFSDLFPNTDHLVNPPVTDWNIDIDGALVLPDGSVVFNFANGGLVKLDRCGRVAWTLARPTHHSVERAEDGSFWVPGRIHHPLDTVSVFPPFQTPFEEDTLLKVGEDGQILAEISVPQLIYDNGLETLLTSTGESFTPGPILGKEIVHLNKIDVLTSDIAGDFPNFEAGDLALSMRNYNLIMVVDPDTKKVKWWRIGPWRRQHDPEFKPGGTIAIFNNNVYRTAFGQYQEYSDPSIPRVSNVMEINPSTGEERILFGGRPDQEMLSVIRGKIDLTPAGGLLVAEFEGGRVFETNASGRIVWEFINRYSATEIAEISEARVYPFDYFDFADWSCAEARN